MLLRRWYFTCISLSEENYYSTYDYDYEFTNSSTTCKFGYIFEVFVLCFTTFKVKKYMPKQTKRKTEKQTQKKKKNHLCVAFLCFIWCYWITDSVNCIHVHVDRVFPINIAGASSFFNAKGNTVVHWIQLFWRVMIIRSKCSKHSYATCPRNAFFAKSSGSQWVKNIISREKFLTK